MFFTNESGTFSLQFVDKVEATCALVFDCKFRTVGHRQCITILRKVPCMFPNELGNQVFLMGTGSTKSMKGWQRRTDFFCDVISQSIQFLMQVFLG